MSKLLQIGSTIYEIPEQGENPSWGEDTTAWICGVTEALTNVQGPNDILTTSAPIANNQTSQANISGLIFNSAQVESVEIDYEVIRTFNLGASKSVEMGKIMAIFDGSDFIMSSETTGDSGIEIGVLSSGQFVYTSSDLTDHTSSFIRFKARTIDTP